MYVNIPSKTDVVICGAGIAGLSTAYFLTKMGITDIVIVDKLPPFSLTSAKSAECYRNWWPNKSMVTFMNRSIDLMEKLAKNSNNVFRLNKRGYCYITKDVNEIGSFEKIIQKYTNLGLGPKRIFQANDHTNNNYEMGKIEGFEDAQNGVDFLTNQLIISHAYPYLSENVKALIHARRCGWFSAQQLGMHFLEEIKICGAKVIQAEVIAVEQDKKGVSSVVVVNQSGMQKINTRRFVNAAGPFTKEIGRMLGTEIPIESILHEKIVFKDYLNIIPRFTPMLIDVDSQILEWTEDEKEQLAEDPQYSWLLERLPGGLYLRPEGGNQSEWVLMGWAYKTVASNPQWQPSLSEEFPDVVIKRASNLVPELAQYVNKLPPLSHDGGYYTKTTENLPLIGPLEVDGAFMVGALSGYGNMAGCAAGELGALWIIGGDLPDYAEELSLERYSDSRYKQSLKQLDTGEL